MINGKLKISNFLGAKAVCACSVVKGQCNIPSDQPSCDSATYSPFTSRVHYSLNHWVEDDPQYLDSPYHGDGSFSSPGKSGFYPWISADKSLYGVLSRRDATTRGAYLASMQCGRAIRRAWMTAKAQP